MIMCLLKLVDFDAIGKLKSQNFRGFFFVNFIGSLD